MIPGEVRVSTEPLEFGERGPQVRDGNRIALQHQAQHVGGTVLGGGVHDGAAPIAPAHRHQPLGLQDAQGLADGDQADVEVLDELLLAGQQIPVAETAVDDLLP